MKACSTCHETKPLAEFNVSRAARDGRARRCRDCCKAWYRDNAAVHKARVLARNQRYRKELCLRVTNYLVDHPCVDCGEDDVRCLEFDHRPGESKLGEVSRMMSNALPWKRILAEIDKCDVRCANCHRKCTSERGGFWRQGVHESLEAEARQRVSSRLMALLPGTS